MSETDSRDSQITDAKKRYSAGVLKYKQMGYWMPDYVPKDTDTLCLFRITPVLDICICRYFKLCVMYIYLNENDFAKIIITFFHAYPDFNK